MSRPGIGFGLVVLAVGILTLPVSPLAAAEEAPDLVAETVFVPPVSYIGDLVEARLTLVLPEGKVLLPPLSLPVQDWVLIRDVQVRHDPPFERVTIKYIPFAPGRKTLPALVLGDVTLDAVEISTASLFDTQVPSDLLAPRDQLLLPHTELALFTLVVLVVALPFAVWRLARPVQALWERTWRRTARRRAYWQLNRDLRRLQSRLAALSGPAFYTELADLLRTYLGARFHRDFRVLTSGEIQALLSPLPPAWAAEWVRLVHRADVVRFDHQDPPEAERLADLVSLRREANRLETKEAGRVDL